MKAELSPHLPMPLSKWTVAYSVPNTKKKPGKSREYQQHQICFSRPRPNPAKQIEYDDDAMKHKKEFVKKCI